MNFTDYYFNLGYNTQIEKVAIEPTTLLRALDKRMGKAFNSLGKERNISLIQKYLSTTTAKIKAKHIKAGNTTDMSKLDREAAKQVTNKLKNFFTKK